MNLLVDKLPTYAEFGGIKYEINSNFRHMIKFELMMADESLTPAEKFARGLRLFYPIVPPCIAEAVEFMIFFYRGGKEAVPDVSESGKEQERIYDYDYDAEYIYAAFLDQYGIDLNEIEYLHWWKFRALFHALTDRTLIVKIMSYRGMEIDNDLPPKQREFYEKMKEQCKIPLSQAEQEKEAAIWEALNNGGNVSKLI